MWRKNIAGKPCLFIGADYNITAALKDCFGWAEMGCINSLRDINILDFGGGSVKSAPVPVIAACMFTKSRRLIVNGAGTDEAYSKTTADMVRATATAVTSSHEIGTTHCDVFEVEDDQVVTSPEKSESPPILYFVEHAMHTSRTLLGAIEAGANAYFTCEQPPENFTTVLEMRLIYLDRGMMLDHRLPVSTVLRAQNLTPFQTRLMQCLRDGVLSDRDIAAALGTSEKMVGKLIGQLFEIFGCNRRSALAKQSIYV